MTRSIGTAAIRGGLALALSGLLLSIASLSGVVTFPLWSALLWVVLGVAVAVWAVDSTHEAHMATPDGRLANVAHRVQALRDFAEGLGLEAVREVEIEASEFHLCVDAALAQGLVEQPPFIRGPWRPDYLRIHGVVCKPGAITRDLDDDAELSGC